MAEDRDTLYQEGLQAYLRQDYEFALERFRLCLAFDPDDGRAHYAIGCCFSRLKITSEASRHFEKTVETATGPALERSRAWLASYRKLLKDPDTAFPDVRVLRPPPNTFCRLHPDTEAAFLCVHCEKPLCLGCARAQDESYLCADCQSKREKKVYRPRTGGGDVFVQEKTMSRARKRMILGAAVIAWALLVIAGRSAWFGAQVEGLQAEASGVLTVVTEGREQLATPELFSRLTMNEKATLTFRVRGELTNPTPKRVRLALISAAVRVRGQGKEARAYRLVKHIPAKGKKDFHLSIPVKKMVTGGPTVGVVFAL